MNGKLSQPLVDSTVMKAVKGVSNQDIASPPNIWMTWLMTPNWEWNMPRQMSAVM